MALKSMPRVERLDLATVRLPADHPAARLGRTVPVYGFVIDHPEGAIVVDTGVGHGDDLIDELYEPSRSRLGDALAAGGFDPTAVVAVVNSHLHFDHCGQNPQFYGTSTPFYVQAAEIEEAQSNPYYTVRGWALPPHEQRQVISGDAQLVDGVTLLATPGHTAGHQSVLVEAGDDRVVIAAQAVWHASEFVAEEASDANVDPIETLRVAAVDSIRRLKALGARVVHFSHCPPHITAA